MAQDQGTYPGLCLLTDSDGKVITIEDSVSGDTVVFTHTNTEGAFDICYPEVLGSGVPEAALANFGTHNVENTATEGYAFTLGDEEYLVRQSVIAPTPGEINDVLYSRSLVVDSNTIDVLVTEDGNVVTYLDDGDNVCFIKNASGEWLAEKPYFDQVVEASGSDPVNIGCTVADGVYSIKYGFNTYVLEDDSLTPEVAEWVDTVLGSFYSRNFNTSSSIWGKAMALIKKRSGNYAAGITIKNFTNTGAGYSEPISEVVCPLFIDTDDIPSDTVPVGQLKAYVSSGRNLGMSALLSEAEGWEDGVLGLTNASIVSVGEIDMDGADIGTTTNIDSSLITMPSFLSDYIIVGTTVELPSQLNSFVIKGTVNAADYVDDLRIDVAGAVANFADGKVMISTTEIGTYELDYQKAIEITSSRTDNVTDVYLA